jgi:small subunit ribosomal protein S5
MSDIQNITFNELSLTTKVAAVNRVTKIIEGGRLFSFSALVIVGNGDGVVGYGLGKASDVTSAISKATNNAKKQLIRIPVLHNTIPHEVKGKYGSSFIIIKPAADGTGIKVGGGARLIFECVGIKNVLSKCHGSSIHNSVKATFNALLKLKDPRTIASVRGVSLDTVFNGL